MKRQVKIVVFLLSSIVLAPLIILALTERRFSIRAEVFVSLSQLLSLLPGKLGSALRAAFYFWTLDSTSWEIQIGFGTFFSQSSASLGRHASIGSFCVIGDAEIGNGVRIASRVSVPSGKRQHFTDDNRLSDETVLERVSIGDDCWIGEGAIVLADVGSQSVVSAGAVVVSSFGERCLIAGNPARCIRSVEV